MQVSFCIASFKRFIIAILFLPIAVYSQKAEKGSSPERPWKDELENGYGKGKQRTALEFGKWRFKGYYPSKNEKVLAREDDNSALKFIFNSRFDVVQLVLTSYDVETEAIDPGGNRFSMNFHVTDSFAETYTTKSFTLKSPENYRSIHFFKNIKGHIYPTSKDSVPFNITIWYRDTIANRSTEIISGNDTITIKIAFDPGMKDSERSNVYGSTYDGFEFYKDGRLISSCINKKDWIGDIIYHYWISPDQNSNTKQLLAGLIFAIVGFID